MSVRYRCIVKIQLTQGQVTFIDDKHADLAALRWHAWKAKTGKTFYAARKIQKLDGKWTTIFLHQVIARRMSIVGAPDHIDRDGESNLRPDPNRRNGANKERQSNNTSGFKGVSWHKGASKYVAQIRVDRKLRHLGYFVDEIEAAKAYDRAARAAFGEFAVLNFPEQAPEPETREEAAA